MDANDGFEEWRDRMTALFGGGGEGAREVARLSIVGEVESRRMLGAAHAAEALEDPLGLTNRLAKVVVVGELPDHTDYVQDSYIEERLFEPIRNGVAVAVNGFRMGLINGEAA